jgi:flagellar basal-body rod protein FlgG
MSPSIDAFDMALSGDGFFELRAGDRTIYSRQGQFRLTADGTLVTPLGHVLQQQGGGDLVLANAAVTILEDGTVLDDGRPVARIALAAPDRLEAMIPVGASAFAADASSMHASDAVVRQGMTESSNVSLSEEMVAMTSVARQAETGARLVQVYDDLLARAISTLGQGR